MTHLAEEISTIVEDAHGKFLTKTDFYHTITPLANNIMLVQGRLSSSEVRELNAPFELLLVLTPKHDFAASPPLAPPPPKSTST
jgi:hypothetical protein